MMPAASYSRRLNAAAGALLGQVSIVPIGVNVRPASLGRWGSTKLW